MAIAEGKFLDVKREKRHRFSEAAERFLDYSQTSKRSYVRDRGIINRHLVPVSGKKHLDEITSWDVELYKASRKDKLSPASVNRELSCLKTTFNKAIHWRLTKENPVRGFKMFRENNRRLRFLMPDKIRDLFACCAPRLRPIVATALHTGMRRGEILNLTWQDIDFDRGHITIRDSKNGESRTAPMNDLLADTLRRHKEERRPKNPFDLAPVSRASWLPDLSENHRGRRGFIGWKSRTAAGLLFHPGEGPAQHRIPAPGAADGAGGSGQGIIHRLS